MDDSPGATLDAQRPMGTSGFADDSVTDAKVKAHTTTKITIPLATQVSGLLGNSNLANLPTLVKFCPLISIAAVGTAI